MAIMTLVTCFVRKWVYFLSLLFSNSWSMELQPFIRVREPRAQDLLALTVHYLTLNTYTEVCIGGSEH